MVVIVTVIVIAMRMTVCFMGVERFRMRFGKIENAINQFFVVHFLCLQQFPNRRMPFHHFRMR